MLTFEQSNIAKTLQFTIYMRIAVNTRFLLNGKLEGLGWFTFETLKRMVTDHPEHEFYFIFDRPYNQKFIFAQNVTPVVAFPPARHPFLWYLWFEWALPRVFKKIKPDIFLSTDGYISLRSKVKTVNVIHDLNFEHYPDQMNWLVRKYYTYFFPRFARHAGRLVTVSEFSKADIVRTYKIYPDKIDVAYNGASNSFKPLNDEQKAVARNTFCNGFEYFIYVGALLPRKNIARLLLAFDVFKQKTGSNMKLLIAGAKMFKTSDIDETFEKLHFKSDVVFTGRLTQSKLELALGGAFGLTYVSYFEGFGIPLIEAMRAHVPVITSNLTSLPEVAGNAAILCNPFSVESIADAMTELFMNAELRAGLIEKGKIRGNFFNWDNTAAVLWQSIEKCLNE